MPVSTLGSISPLEVHAVLARHMLADGYDLVLDFEKSHGARLHDAKSGREYLDFSCSSRRTRSASTTPSCSDPEFLEVLHRVAPLNPSNSDFYTVEYASSSRRSDGSRCPSTAHVFFVAGGALGVENALKAAFDWKVRRNSGEGDPRREGPAGDPLPRGVPRPLGLHAVAHEHRPAQDRVLPEVRLAADRQSRLRFPVTPEVERDTAEAETAALDAIERAFAENTDDIAAIIIEPIQAEGGDNHFRPEFLRALERRRASTTRCSSSTRCRRAWASRAACGPTSTRRAARRGRVRQEDAGVRLMVGPRVDEAPDNVFQVSSRINSTWGGNLIDMVRSARCLEILDEERLVENARVMGERLSPAS